MVDSHYHKLSCLQVVIGPSGALADRENGIYTPE